MEPPRTTTKIKPHPHYKISISKMYDKIKDGCPLHEQPPTATMPSETACGLNVIHPPAVSHSNHAQRDRRRVNHIEATNTNRRQQGGSGPPHPLLLPIQLRLVMFRLLPEDVPGILQEHLPERIRQEQHTKHEC